MEADQPKKAKRKRITPEQLEDLVGLFEKTDTPSFEVREKLAKKLGMSNREIQVCGNLACMQASVLTLCHSSLTRPCSPALGLVPEQARQGQPGQDQ